MKDVTTKTVCGIGYMGEEGYNSTNYPKAYKLWANMLNRCHGNNQLEAYKDVVVAEEWHNFSQFAKDIKNLKGYADWFDGKKWELDKDLINREARCYSKETCCFIPKNLNLKASRLGGHKWFGPSYDVFKSI